MSVQGNYQLSMSFTELLYNPSSALALETITRTFADGATAITISDGSGVDQVSKAFALRETLTATSRTLDLTNLTTTTGGTVTTVSFSLLKLVYAVNDATGEGQFLKIGGAGSAPFYAWWGGSTHYEKLPPLGSQFLKVNRGQQTSNPWTVDGSNKNLLIDAGASTIPYRLLILGC